MIRVKEMEIDAEKNKVVQDTIIHSLKFTKILVKYFKVYLKVQSSTTANNDILSNLALIDFLEKIDPPSVEDNDSSLDTNSSDPSNASANKENKDNGTITQSDTQVTLDNSVSTNKTYDNYKINYDDYKLNKNKKFLIWKKN